MMLKTLYKKNKNKTIQVCNISTLSNSMIVEFGQLGGKMQIKETTCYPKNIGKTNATSAEAQAKIEALAKYNKKIKSGFKLKLS